MSLSPPVRLPRIALAIAFALVAFLAATADSQAAPNSCAQATASAASIPATSAGRAVRCLVNAERAAHGLAPLRAAGKLRVAAQRHAADMVARRYFEHASLDGSSVTDRVRRAGYLSGAGRFAVGENIGWGAAQLASPTAVVDAWMHSPGHRAVILDRRYREAGIGVAAGIPSGGGSVGATFVLDVGTRA